MTAACFIANGTALDEGRIAAFAALVRERQPQATVQVSTSRTEFRRLAQAAQMRGPCRVVVAGGDGTVCAAANAFVGTGVELAWIPMGRANHLARSFAFPAEPAAALALALEGQALPLDVVRVDYRDNGFRTMKAHFVNCAEMGFGAELLRLQDKVRRWTSRRLAGSLAPALAGRASRNCDVRLIIDGQDLGLRPATSVVVGNARYLEAGPPVFPEARLDDGVMEVLRVGAVDPATLMVRGRALQRAPDQQASVRRWNARRVEASCEDPVPIAIDGELLGWLPAAFEVVPAAFRLVLPG